MERARRRRKSESPDADCRFPALPTDIQESTICDWRQPVNAPVTVAILELRGYVATVVANYTAGSRLSLATQRTLFGDDHRGKLIKSLCQRKHESITACKSATWRHAKSNP